MITRWVLLFMLVSQASTGTLPVLLEDDNMEVVVKVMATASRECRRLEQLLGARPWRSGDRDDDDDDDDDDDSEGTCDAVARDAPSVRRGGGRAVWEALRLVPLAHDSLVRFVRQPTLSALVMRKLRTLTQAARLRMDVRVLLRVVCQLVQVRRVRALFETRTRRFCLSAK